MIHPSLVNHCLANMFGNESVSITSLIWIHTVFIGLEHDLNYFSAVRSSLFFALLGMLINHVDEDVTMVTNLVCLSLLCLFIDLQAFFIPIHNLLVGLLPDSPANASSLSSLDLDARSSGSWILTHTLRSRKIESIFLTEEQLTVHIVLGRLSSLITRHSEVMFYC